MSNASRTAPPTRNVPRGKLKIEKGQVSGFNFFHSALTTKDLLRSRIELSAELKDMCICVNCHWVDRCQAYHAVERQHAEAHLNEAPDIKPKDPRIHISVIGAIEGETEIEWDVRACESFIEDEGRWLRLCPGKELPK